MVSYDDEELNKCEPESVWCKIKAEIIAVLGRSQVTSQQELHELFKVISTASQGKILKMGDFNYLRINSNANNFRDLLLDHYLYQHVREPTRESIILYLVIGSDENMVTGVEVLEHLGNSDHNIIVCGLMLDVEPSKTSSLLASIIRQIMLQ